MISIFSDAGSFSIGFSVTFLPASPGIGALRVRNTFAVKISSGYEAELSIASG
jgi:hypothetical protein